MDTISVVQLVVRHLPQCAMLLIATYCIARFNTWPVELQRMLNDISISDHVSSDDMRRITALHKVIDDSKQRLCMKICTFNVDYSFLRTCSFLAFQYVGMGPTMLNFV